MAEKWDLYTRIGNSFVFQQTGQTIERGQKLPDGTFHHVVHAWVRTDIGEYLISQRCAEKSNPLCWEPTGGSVLAGETARQAAVREVKEELGINLDPDSGTFVCRGVRFFPGCNDFVDVWLFEKDYKSIEKSLTLQKEERLGGAALVARLPARLAWHFFLFRQFTVSQSASRQPRP